MTQLDTKGVWNSDLSEKTKMCSKIGTSLLRGYGVLRTNRQNNFSALQKQGDLE